MNTRKATAKSITMGCNGDLVSCLESCREKDIDLMLGYFAFVINNVKSQSRINDIRRRSKNNEDVAVLIMDLLFDFDVSVEDMYKCFIKSEIITAAEVLKSYYPDLDAEMQQEQVHVRDEKPILTSNPISNLYQITPPQQVNTPNNRDLIESVNEPINDKVFFNPNVASSESQLMNKELTMPVESNILAELYESIMPVVPEEPMHSKHNNYRLLGKFELIYVNERNMSFQKRSFTDGFQYITELNMIKCLHLNLYTPVCIYKSLVNKSYSLLYPYDGNSTRKLLSEYASQMNTSFEPSQFNVLHQLVILRDISCGLSYLHKTTNFKRQHILHGDLRPECVIIEVVKDQVSAKLFDFVKSVNTDKLNESSYREELFNFGRLIYTVLSWKHIDATTCVELHNQLESNRKKEEAEQIVESFRKLKLNVQPHMKTRHSVFCVFFKLTSPNHDLSKGVDKYYDKFINLIQNLNNESKENLPRK